MISPSGALHRITAAAALGLIAAFGAPAAAQDVNITQDMPYFEFDNGTEFIVIERNCIQPMEVAPGVVTIGELELLDFLDTYVSKRKGALIDARLETWYQGGTIPGSVNFAFNLFENPDANPFLEPVLQILGGVHNSDGTWDFSNALELALFCNGPFCGQSPRAIRNLLSIGYPAEKMRYYRGGMQAWVSLGLTVYVPGSGT